MRANFDLFGPTFFWQNRPPVFSALSQGVKSVTLFWQLRSVKMSQLWQYSSICYFSVLLGYCPTTLFHFKILNFCLKSHLDRISLTPSTPTSVQGWSTCLLLYGVTNLIHILVNLENKQMAEELRKEAVNLQKVFFTFYWLGPGRVSHRVDMSVCLFVWCPFSL